MTTGAIDALLALVPRCWSSRSRGSSLFRRASSWPMGHCRMAVLLQTGEFPGERVRAGPAGLAAAVFGFDRGAGLAPQPAIGAALESHRETVAFPFADTAITCWAAPLKPGLVWRDAAVARLVTPLRPDIYRMAFQRLLGGLGAGAPASPRSAMHLALTGLGLVFFGAEGWRTAAVLRRRASSSATHRGHRADPLSCSATTAVADGRALSVLRPSPDGKALRATAVNRVGARLVGIRAGAYRGRHRAPASPRCIGALFGILIGPIDDDLLRFRLPHRPEGLCRRDHRRARQLSAGRRRRILVGLVEIASPPSGRARSRR